jgi:predicted nucleic acid-binding protein
MNDPRRLVRIDRLFQRKLRKTGVTVRKTIDVIIATFCIMEGLTLLHDDRDFDPIAFHFSLQTAVSPKGLGKI